MGDRGTVPDRCLWVAGADPLMTRYHDEEWGIPVRDDVRLFEFLILEGAQAGLSWRTMSELPADTPVSEAMSRELARRGFRFVGPTICYAILQAVGMVNDRLVTCFRHRGISRSGEARVRLPESRPGTELPGG